MRAVSVAVVGVALAASLTASAASASPGDDTVATAAPTSSPDGDSADEMTVAEQRRLDPGDAYMGWSLEGEYSGAPAPRVAPLSTLGRPGVQGIDVSGHQPSMNWQREWDRGIRFAYVKATEGNYFRNPLFSAQYSGAYEVGIVRGAYHFGNPDVSGGAEQARYFVEHGGGWSPDGMTLPGVLDIEDDPYGDDDRCFGQTANQLITWINDFATTYKALTGRAAVIYSNPSWWATCTGNSSEFARTNPLWFARWAPSAGALPGGWQHYTFWQYTSDPFDHDVFNGTLQQLRSYATDPGLHVPGNGDCLPSMSAPDFCDVATSHLFADEIAWLAAEQISTGYADGRFHPERGLTREAMAAFLYRYSGEPEFTAPAVSPFSDLPTNAPFYYEISWLAHAGIATGYDDGTFRPRNAISREAMAAFLYRFQGVSDYVVANPPFRDVPRGATFYEEIAWLADEGVTTGYSDGTFRPRNAISREAMAAFLYRLDALR